MKKILIINGHPDRNSLCSELALSYKRGANKTSADCSLVNLADLNFDPVLHHGYKQRTEFEPDLLTVQKEIRANASNFLVFGSNNRYPIRHRGVCP